MLASVGRALLGVLVVAASVPAAAAASPVIVLSPSGHAVVRDDPFVPAVSLTPTPPAAVAAAVPRGQARHRRHRPPPQPTVRTELARLRRTNAITAGDYKQYDDGWSAALAAVHRLSGTRAIELESVVQNMHVLAVSKQLTPARLPALFLTLARNRQWWTTGPLPYSGERVEFSGSGLVWQYYPGQGLGLQVLGSFARADGLYTARPSQFAAFKALLGELIPLAVTRGGGLAWEYYFSFDGGSPPWVSAMAQGTALEALTRAYQAFGDRSYLAIAHRTLPLFAVAPPIGVAVPTPLGARYLQYSFASGTSIINAFLQALIGLYDYAHASGDPQASALFAGGDAEARAEVPQFDTGAWSLYQPGVEDSLDYHNLVTGFLRQLCTSTQATAYCTAASHFKAYLTTPPALMQLTTRARVKRAVTLWFRLSKHSHVGIVVVDPKGSTVFLTSGYFGYGVNAFAVPALTSPGQYTIRLAATDDAGNFNRIVGTMRVVN